MTIAEIKDLINRKIRFKLPKVLKTELADVFDDVVNYFEDKNKTIFIEDNQTKNLVINGILTPRVESYGVFFEKIGRKVSFSGTVVLTGIGEENGFELVLKNADFNIFDFFNYETKSVARINSSNKTCLCTVRKDSNNLTVISFFQFGEMITSVDFSGQYISNE